MVTTTHTRPSLLDDRRALSVRVGVRAKAVRVDDRKVATGGLDQAEIAQRAQGAAGRFER